MGVVASKSAPLSEYSLLQDGLQFETISVSTSSDGARTRCKTWRMKQDSHGELIFDLDELPRPGTRDELARPSSQIAWILDPTSSRKTARTALLKLDVPEGGQLDFSFVFKPSCDSVGPAGISIACVASPEDLEQLLLERKRSEVGRHPFGLPL